MKPLSFDKCVRNLAIFGAFLKKMTQNNVTIVGSTRDYIFRLLKFYDQWSGISFETTHFLDILFRMGLVFPHSQFPTIGFMGH